jgi:hypothetical protein
MAVLDLGGKSLVSEKSSSLKIRKRKIKIKWGCKLRLALTKNSAPKIREEDRVLM